MAAAQNNQFLFKHSEHLTGVTALHAVMRDFSYEKHAHEEIALGVTLAGRQDFSCKGVRFKSAPGNIILFNPEDVHDGNPGNHATLKYAMLYIHPDEFAPIISSAGKKESASFRIQETLLQDPALRTQILSLYNLIFTGNGSKLEQESHLYEIAKWFAQKMGHFQPNKWTRKKDTLLMNVKEYIHENLPYELSIDELCAIANLSKFHFIRMFRHQFGITPHQYVLSCRINKARTALEKGCTPSDTAHLLGFTDVSHLNRRFKRIYGITPKQYQIQISR